MWPFKKKPVAKAKYAIVKEPVQIQLHHREIRVICKNGQVYTGVEKSRLNYHSNRKSLITGEYAYSSDEKLTAVTSEPYEEWNSFVTCVHQISQVILNKPEGDGQWFIATQEIQAVGIGVETETELVDALKLSLKPIEPKSV